MITLSQALQLVDNTQVNTSTEKINFLKSLSRISAKNLISDVNMPPFNKSAVDGYACKINEIDKNLEIIETIQAGEMPQKIISQNQCSKIFTGAMLPLGADCVLMVEDTEVVAENQIRYLRNETNRNIAFCGEDVKKGEIILPKGTIIGPKHIGILAATGNIAFEVFAKPRIAVVVTGNELVEPDEIPYTSKIRNSNAYQLISQIEKLGAISNYYGIIPDDFEKLKNAISKIATENELILLTGGVSMGDFDFIPQVLDNLGFTKLFHRILVQPGKPVLFAENSQTKCFGLPGNPVSTFMIFEYLVKPLIFKMMGTKFEPICLNLEMSDNYFRQKTERTLLLPIGLTKDGKVKILNYHGSAHVSILTEAFGFLEIPIGQSVINQGDRVNVRPF